MTCYREVCTVLQELRDYLEHVLDEDKEYHRYKRHTFALVEEVQSHVNRMESSLYAGRDIKELSAEVRRLTLIKEELEEDTDCE